jgi:spore germination protein PE
MNRTSLVNYVILTSIADSSTFIAGDVAKITSNTRAYAVQRQVAVFFKEEGEFEDFPLFSREIPRPGIAEQVNMRVIQESPYIRVNSVDVIGVAQGSSMQIGSTLIIDLEARIKHFRQFVKN